LRSTSLPCGRPSRSFVSCLTRQRESGTRYATNSNGRPAQTQFVPAVTCDLLSTRAEERLNFDRVQTCTWGFKGPAVGATSPGDHIPPRRRCAGLNISPTQISSGSRHPSSCYGSGKARQCRRVLANRSAIVAPRARHANRSAPACVNFTCVPPSCSQSQPRSIASLRAALYSARLLPRRILVASANAARATSTNPPRVVFPLSALSRSFRAT
jgi:hypothetical protein